MGSMTAFGWYVASIMPPVDDAIGKHEYQGWRPCIQWCSEHFSDDDEAPCDQTNRWRFVGEGVFEFRREEDRLLFLLRWA